MLYRRLVHFLYAVELVELSYAVVNKSLKTRLVGSMFSYMFLVVQKVTYMDGQQYRGGGGGGGAQIFIPLTSELMLKNRIRADIIVMSF